PVVVTVAIAVRLTVVDAKAATFFPLKYSADKRYLVDQAGTPFPILGRTAGFITSLTEADKRFFIDDTVARGYTAIEFHLVNHDPRGQTPPFDGDGRVPFLKRLDGTPWNGSLSYTNTGVQAPDFTSPNETYWQLVDTLLAYCEARGILVLMFPAYVGYLGGEQ